jgi:hypothetical protein
MWPQPLNAIGGLFFIMSDRTKEDRITTSSMADINLIISTMICQDKPVRRKGSKVSRKDLDCSIYI